MLGTAGSSQGCRHPPRGAWGSTGRTRTHYGHFLPSRPDWQPWSWAHKMQASSLPSTFLLLKRFEGTRLLDASPLPLVCAPATIHSPHNSHRLKARVPLQSECFFSSRPPGSSKPLVFPSPTIRSPLPRRQESIPHPAPRIHRPGTGPLCLCLPRSMGSPHGHPSAQLPAWLPGATRAYRGMNRGHPRGKQL